MIARALDSQAAGKIEPQLTAIVEELRAIRNQGGIAAGPADTPRETVESGLIVYYFHSNTRCPTCRAIESQAHDAVRTGFSDRLNRGEIAWKTLNYEQPAVRPLAEKFDVQVPVVVLAKMQDGKVQQWKRLDDVWALWDDKPAYAKYVRGEIERILAGGSGGAPPPSKAEAKPGPADLPIPQ
jgi:hypothetical protein